MDNIVNKAIMLVLSAVLTIAVIITTVTSLQQYTKITNRLNDEHMAKESLIKLMKLDMYDNKVVSGVSVADAIMQSRSEDIGIYIEDKGVFYNYKINLTTGEYQAGALQDNSDFELAEITKIGGNVNLSKNYQANIIYDVNDDVGVIKFKVL